MNGREVEVYMPTVWDNMWLPFAEGAPHLAEFQWGNYFEHIKSLEAACSYVATITCISGAAFAWSKVAKGPDHDSIFYNKLSLPTDTNQSVVALAIYTLALCLGILGAGFLDYTCRKAIRRGYASE
jgi:hypothetical protein